MRAYVLFAPQGPAEIHDGIRLRKSIKGALHEVGVDVVESFSDLPDIVHILSPIHDREAVDMKGLGTKVVSSALYAESDPRARYLEYPEEGPARFTPRALTLLKHSDLVFVPSAYAENIVKKALPEAKTEILPFPVDAEKLGHLSEASKNAFYHYFMVKPGRPHAFVKGDYDDEEGLLALTEAAYLLPEIDFYFFGMSDSPNRSTGAKQKLNLKGPENLRFCDARADDLYLSGLSTSLFYLSLSYRHADPIGVIEAFAAGIQVFRLGPAPIGDPLEKDDLAYGCLSPEELSLKVRLYQGGKLPPIMARQVAFDASYKKAGETMKEAYHALLKGEEDDRS